jgi:hypothetical protein
MSMYLTSSSRAGKLGLVIGDVRLEHLLLLGVGRLVEHLLCGLDVIEGLEVLARLGHEGGLVGVFLCDTRVLLGVGDDGRVDHLLLQLLVRGNDLLELVAHGSSPCRWAAAHDGRAVTRHD